MDSAQLLATRLADTTSMLQQGTRFADELQGRLRHVQRNCHVFLDSSGNMTIKMTASQFSGDAGSVRRNAPMLCRVLPGDSAPGFADDARVAMFTAVDSLKYRPARRATFDKQAQKALSARLQPTGGLSQSAPAWPAFLNQASFSFATRRRFFLWIGDPSRLDRRPPHRNSGVMPCVEPDDSTAIYHARVLGMLTLLITEIPRVPAVMYVDADVWFSDVAHGPMARYGCCLPESYLQLAPQASVMANGNHFKRPYGVFFNTGAHCQPDLAVTPR